MKTNYFDGYTGIRVGDGQSYYDILLLAVILLIALFAFTFRYYYPLFVKMWRDLISLKERRSIFDTDIRKSLLLEVFMQFQGIFLVAVFCFVIYYHHMGKTYSELKPDFVFLSAIFALIGVYFLFKRLLYFIYGHLFNEKNEYRLWAMSYDTIFYIWELLLYIPVLLIIFDRTHIVAASVFFLISYILFRIAVIYITFRIFYHKKTGFLYLSLYLCTQEIIPLLFLYEGFKYLHNIIQMSTLWH